MKKILSFLFVMLFSFTLITGCKDKEKDPGDTETCTQGGDMTLEDLNKMLNDKVNMNMNKANTVAIIPFNHVNGPGDEWKFYALVNFQYEDIMEGYVKYQVTYLSCTCRTADVNYWQTAYIELDLPESGVANDVKLRKLSFDKDGTGHYLAGFWGDSSPILDEATQSEVIATYEKTETSPGSGVYYPSIKEDFIPLLEGKTKAQIDSYNKMVDMKDAGVMTSDAFDSFHGASVSTNNILRILHAVFKYHAETYKLS